MARDAEGQGLMLSQVTVFEGEGMDDFAPRPAAKEPFAVLGKDQPVERLFQRGPADQVVRGQFHHRDFVLAITGMKHGGKFAARMHRHVHRKVTQQDLLAHRAEKPLVGQQHPAISLRARRVKRRRSREARPCGAGRRKNWLFPGGRAGCQQGGQRGSQTKITYHRLPACQTRAAR